MSKGYYPADQFDTMNTNQFGGIYVTIKGDIIGYYVNKDQRWIPHAIPDTTHPATIGDMITVTKWLSKRLGITLGFVTGVRTLKSSKRCNGIRQVELLGLPCQWFGITHFAEYANRQISDRIWDVVYVTPYGQPNQLFDRSGKKVILPNL